MQERDIWHFIYDDLDGSWMWQRRSTDGELLAKSDFTFRSVNVCCADAERAGYLSRLAPSRRVRAAELLTEDQARAVNRGRHRDASTLKRLHPEPEVSRPASRRK